MEFGGCENTGFEPFVIIGLGWGSEITQFVGDCYFDVIGRNRAQEKADEAAWINVWEQLEASNPCL